MTSESRPNLSPTPASRLRGLRAYQPTRPRQPIDLWLDANEGVCDGARVARAPASITPDRVRRYPDASELERRIGAKYTARFGLEPGRVLVTAGADDAINRLCLATLEPGRTLLQHTPTFTMIEHSARLAGADVSSVGWTRGAFPTDAMLERIVEGVGLVSIVTPNNPTGSVAGLADIRAIAARAAEVGALVMVDFAYAEFADEDPTPALLEIENCVVVRTLSKAWGMAGLRVGCLLGPGEVIGWCRATGGPFAVSGVSLGIAGAMLGGDAAPSKESIQRVRGERARLASVLGELGASPFPSEANFVLGEWGGAAGAAWVRDALAGLGIWIRGFDGPDLAACTRITCPGDDASFDRLERALRAACAPEAVLFDLDGVLADVSTSYRTAIVRTVESFGGRATPEEIGAVKRAGDANNDWVLSRRLLERQGVSVSLEAVTARFEAFYQGDAAGGSGGGSGGDGLWRSETTLVDRAMLERLRTRAALGVVTGRPRRDARRFLETNGLDDLVDTLVCMEDGPAKPAPDVVSTALERLGVERAWMIGDTVDDVRAARAAGVVPLGVVAPGDDPRTTADALLDAGAARVIGRVEELLEVLP